MADAADTAPVVRFGVFEVDLAARELRKSGVRIKLQDQPFRVLALLLGRPGEIVTREELREAIWSEDTFVEFDASLNTAIQKIRQALGDSATSPRFVETVPRRGYRFAENVDAPTAAAQRQERRIPKGAFIGLGAVVAALAVVSILATGPDTPPTPSEAPRHFVISTEGDVSLLSNRALISPDGRWIAYESGGSPSSRAVTLWLQDLQHDKPRRIAGPARLSLVGWSPDSRQLSYMEDSALFRLPTEDRQPVRIAELDFGAPAQSGSWSPDGQTIILVPPVGAQRLVEVQVQGGEQRTVLSREGDDAGGQFHSVHYLSGFDSARRIVYGETRNSEQRIVAADLDTGVKREVLTGGHRPFYSASGHLLYQNIKNRIMVLPFSPKTLTARGAPQRAPVEYLRGGRNPTVSINGTLVYLTHGGGSQQIVWRDRRGVEIGTVGQPQEIVRYPTLSPDGKWVAVRGEDDGVAALWLHEVDRPAKKKITFGLWVDRSAWRPDGTLIAYTGPGEGYADIFVKSPHGSREPALLVSSHFNEFPYSWSRDGRYLIFSGRRKAGWRSDLLRMEVDEDGKPLEETVILATEFDEYSPVLSPDNRFLAYASDKSGRHEIYVCAFPDCDREWLVSTNGGVQARWRGDGRELYYVRRADGTLFSVPITLSPEFSPGQPERLFQDDNLAFRGHQYDVTADGRRFLVPKVLKESKSVIRVVDNWFTELRELERAQ